MDGRPIRSCVVAVSAVSGAITTLGGLAVNGQPHAVQQAFIDEQVPFCGYCINGWVMYTVALLESNVAPNDTEIREAFSGLKCRCGSHTAILRAVKRAARQLKAR